MSSLNYILLTVLLVIGWSATAQPGSATPGSEENRQARVWFSEARFGIMLHIGLYSLLAGGGDKASAEWIQRDKRISNDDYARLTTFFNPTAFDADELVNTCRQAGAKYLNFTVKHADGFGLYDSPASDFDVMATPFGRDMVAEIAKACALQNVGLFLHYYQMDKHQPDYAAGSALVNGDSSAAPRWQRYLAFQNAQLRELLRYEAVRGIWLNGLWELGQKVDWRLGDTYGMIHQLRPGVLIANNHHLGILPGEDFYLYYKKLPTDAAAPYPKEAFRGISKSWGYNLLDRDFFPADSIINNIVRTAGFNCNFMLNVALMPNGQFPPEVKAILGEVGACMRQNGESIYGTVSGPVPPQSWGVTTRKGNVVYVHVLKPGNRLVLPNWQLPVRRVRLFGENQNINNRKTGSDLVLDLTNVSVRHPDTIIEIEITEPK